MGISAALAWAAAGCGSEPGEAAEAAGEVEESAGKDDPEGVERAAAQAADPALNEAVVLALPQLPRKFDPHDDLEPWAERIGDDLLFEGLVRRGGDRYPWVEPGLADRCEVDREYAVASVTCHIPEGIRFHDGSEVTMEDVEYSVRLWVLPQRSWLRERSGLATLDRVEIVDGPRGAPGRERDPGRWIRLGFDKREPLALEALTAIKIVPKAAHRGRSTRFSQQPIGTGPMRLESMDGERIVLERFEGYREGPSPSACRPRGPSPFERSATAPTRSRPAPRGGPLPRRGRPIHVPVELGKPGMAGRFRGWVVSPAQYDMLLWNLGKGLSADSGLRQALHDALPLSAITRDVHQSPGLGVDAPVDLHAPVAIDLDALADIKAGEPVRGGLLPLPDFEADARAQVGASMALDALEWPVEAQGLRRRPGGPLRFILAWDGTEGRAGQTAELIREAWRSVGVAAPQSTTSWRFLLSVIQKGDFRVAMVHLGGHSDEDLYHLFHSRGAINYSRVDDELLDAALSDYRGAPDRAARDAAKARVAQRLAELRVVSVLYAPTHVVLASRRLQGVEFVDDMPRLTTLSLTPGDIDWGAERSALNGDAG
ncbi:hypothetical protein PPSIR1_10190 [Plesiocystis pacifica SIR-1]|uniref:Solute-binding protein family 5 domain-containing protein n=1 Tax=Plesiocystis pacifica SIR-1 TaxID=391625 RepID=A6GJ72_9BACT|nr:ABC transporter substrate-binding protein [Plesiocystis pacifica]EDM74080.1 hypothetical protein PPSIR1_10190 [Plesiocystis pacifica SIR-1]